MEIRRALTGDRNRCLELLETLGGQVLPAAADVFEQLLTGERGAVLVAEHDDEIVGMISISFNLAMRYGGEYSQLEELIVDPAARGLKAGGDLVQSAVDLAKARGCKESGLYLVASTEHNQAVYEKYGYRRVGSEMRQALV